MRTVRYTGARSGLESFQTPGFGAIALGDLIELSDEQATRWVTSGNFEEAEAQPGDTVRSRYDTRVVPVPQEPEPPKRKRKAASKTAEDKE